MDNKYQFRTLRQLLQKFRVIGLLVLLIICILIIVCFFQQVTLSFAVMQNEEESWTPLIEQFQAKYKNIKINLKPIGENVPNSSDKLKKELVDAFKGKPYDLLYLDIVWVPEFAEKGWLMDLTQKFPPEELKKEGFLLNEIENGCYGGKDRDKDPDKDVCKGNGSKLYRVPFRTDIGVLYYRKDLVTQGEIPKTFEQLKTISKKYQNQLQTTKEDSWGYLWPGQGESLVAMFTEVLHGYGGYWIRPEEVGDKKVGLDETAAIEAVKFLRDTIDNISPSNVTKYLEEDFIINKFVAGEAVFMRHWPYVWNRAHESRSEVSGKIDIIPMVHEDKKTSSGLSKGGWGFGVAEKTNHKDAAIKAIEFFTSAPIQRQFTLSYGSMPSRRKLFFDPKIVARYRHYPKLLNWMDDSRDNKDNTDWIARPRIPQYTKASSILQMHLNEALKSIDEEGIKKAMGQAADKTRKLLRGEP